MSLHRLFNITAHFNSYSRDQKNPSHKPLIYIRKCENDTLMWDEKGIEYKGMRSINGNGTFVFNKKSYCKQLVKIDKISGNIINGDLEGPATVVFTNKERLVASFRGGVLNGISRMFRCEFESCGAFEDPELNKPTKLGEVIPIICCFQILTFHIDLNSFM